MDPKDGRLVIGQQVDATVEPERCIHKAAARPAHPCFDPFGRVFISYRASDGGELAARLSNTLWAHGVPPWFDVDDLRPGDLERRLQESLQAGLSGAVLLLTPGVAASRVVEKVELPELFKLENEPNFTLLVASCMKRADGEIDYTAPDTLLRMRPGTLSRFKQYSIEEEGALNRIASELVRRRVELCGKIGGSPIVLDIDTRSRLAPPRPQVALVIRTEPEDGKREPPFAFWGSYASLLSKLRGFIMSTGNRKLRIRGGAHLSAAFALGAAVPTTAACDRD